MKRIVSILILMMTIIACSTSNKSNIDELIEQMQPQSFQLLYQEEVGNRGMFVLFQDESGFRHAFYTNRTIGNDASKR